MTQPTTYTIIQLPDSSTYNIIWGSKGIIHCNTTNDCPYQAGCYTPDIASWTSFPQCSCDVYHNTIGLTCSEVGPLGQFYAFLVISAMCINISTMSILIWMITCGGKDAQMARNKLTSKKVLATTAIFNFLGAFFLCLDSIYELILTFSLYPRDLMLSSTGPPTLYFNKLNVVTAVCSFLFGTLGVMIISLAWMQLAESTRQFQPQPTKDHPLLTYKKIVIVFYFVFGSLIIAIPAASLPIEYSYYVLCVAMFWIFISYVIGYYKIKQEILPTLRWLKDSRQRQQQLQQKQDEQEDTDNSVNNNSNNNSNTGVDDKLAAQMRLIATTAITVAILSISCVIIAIGYVGAELNPNLPGPSFVYAFFWITASLDVFVVAMYVMILARNLVSKFAGTGTTTTTTALLRKTTNNNLFTSDNNNNKLFSGGGAVVAVSVDGGDRKGGVIIASNTSPTESSRKE
jgi:hypothetical protein